MRTWLGIKGLVRAVVVIGSALAEGAVREVSSVSQLEAALVTARTSCQAEKLVVQAGTCAVTAGLAYVPAAGEDAFPLLIEGDGAMVTILDSGASGSFSIATDSLANDTNRHVTLRGLTSRNGNGCEGRALEARGRAAGFPLERNVFRDDRSCDGDGGGAAVSSLSRAITVKGNLFTGNAHDTSSYDGGGAFLRVETGVVTVTNDALVGTTTNGGRGDGLAIFLLGGPARADLFNNIAWGNGTEDVYVNDDGSGHGIGAATRLFHDDYGVFTIVDGDHLAQGANIQLNPSLSVIVQLVAGSPAVDPGDNLAPGLPAVDLEGEPGRTVPAFPGCRP